jgi:hypothetical protein
VLTIHRLSIIATLVAVSDRALYFASGKLIRVVRSQRSAPPAEDFSAWDQRPSELVVMAREFARCARPRHRATCTAPSRGA